MTDDGDKRVSLRYFSKCQNTSNENVETDTCDSLKVGDEVQFSLQIEVSFLYVFVFIKWTSTSTIFNLLSCEIFII